jgi:hypothetical protein
MIDSQYMSVHGFFCRPVQDDVLNIVKHGYRRWINHRGIKCLKRLVEHLILKSLKKPSYTDVVKLASLLTLGPCRSQPLFRMHVQCSNLFYSDWGPIKWGMWRPKVIQYKGLPRAMAKTPGRANDYILMKQIFFSVQSLCHLALLIASDVTCKLPRLMDG